MSRAAVNQVQSSRAYFSGDARLGRGGETLLHENLRKVADKFSASGANSKTESDPSPNKDKVLEAFMEADNKQDGLLDAVKLYLEGSDISLDGLSFDEADKMLEEIGNAFLSGSEKKRLNVKSSFGKISSELRTKLDEFQPKEGADD